MNHDKFVVPEPKRRNITVALMDFIWSAFIFIAIIYAIYSYMLVISQKALRPLLFKYEYSYNNIKLYTSNDINEEKIDEILTDVHDRACKSSLYDSQADYVVYLANSKRTEMLYFWPQEDFSGFKYVFSNIKNIKENDVFYTLFSQGLGGYALPYDAKGTAFVRNLDVELITHELTHQMVIRALDNKVKAPYYLTKKLSISEGYADLIARDISTDYKYEGSDIMGYSSSYSPEHVVHADGETYQHLYRTIHMGGIDSIYEYSLENSLIMGDMLLQDDIISLIKGTDSMEKYEKAATSFYLNYFQATGYRKVESDINVLKGTWVKLKCENEEYLCEFYE